MLHEVSECHSLLEGRTYYTDEQYRKKCPLSNFSDISILGIINNTCLVTLKPPDIPLHGGVDVWSQVFGFITHEIVHYNTELRELLWPLWLWTHQPSSRVIERRLWMVGILEFVHQTHN